MSRTMTRGEALATRLEAVTDEMLTTVSACTDEQWCRATVSEGWPVGVVAHHVAEVQRFFAGILTALAAGERSPAVVLGEDIDQNNARHARDFAAVGKPETLNALRDSGATLTRVLRALSDEDLGTVALAIDGQELSAEQVVELALINHFREHLASIRAAMMT